MPNMMVEPGNIPVGGTVTGTVANVRKIPSTSGNAPVSTLSNGAQVLITGFTLTNATHSLWYRFSQNGQLLWISASLVSIDQTMNIPFVPASEIPSDVPLDILDDPAKARLASVGISLTDSERVELSFATHLVNTLVAYGVRLDGEWSAANLNTVLSILQNATDYAVTFSSRRLDLRPNSKPGGAWKLSELQLVDSAITKAATRTHQLFERKYGQPIPDTALPFRILYGPLRIARLAVINVNPRQTGSSPTDRWLAINPDGFQVGYGNWAFIDETKFKAIDLLTHELSHTINWRYEVGDSGKSPQNFYRPFAKVELTAGESPTGQAVTVNFSTIDEGYTTFPRSTNDDYEVVTDAITNDTVGGYADDLKGRARAKEVDAFLFGAIDYRVKTWGKARQHLPNVLQGPAGLLEPALKLLENHEDADLVFLNGLA